MSAIPEPAPGPRVVIIGAGFAGLTAARELGGTAVSVTLVDRHNFHTFQPLLYQIATAGLEPADIAYPVRAVLARYPNLSFRHATVSAVDTERAVVRLDGGAELPYDHLVVATGAAASYFEIPGARKHALALYTLADARRLRNHVLSVLEAQDAAQGTGECNFLVVGAGPTGVEIAGAISELLSISMRRDGLRLDVERTRIILVDVESKVLPGFPATASRYARRILEQKGIECYLGRSVERVESDYVVLDGGEQVATTTVVWAAGITVSGTIAEGIGDSATRNGRLAVDADLRVKGRENVWAIGDAAAVPRGHGEELSPQLAPVAIQSGRHCARQILRASQGQSTEPFSYLDKGIMATIGRNAAVACVPHVPVITGVAGWLAWLGLHLVYLIGFRNRLRVLINWAWRYFDWPSGPRLIVADAETCDDEPDAP